MRILFAADVHIDQDLLAQLAQQVLERHADVLIIGGDIVPHHLPRMRSLGMLDAQADYIDRTLIPTLSRLKARCRIDIFLDFSNDDLAANHHKLLPHQDALLNLLHMQKIPLSERVDIIGYMIVPPTPFQRKDWERPDAAGVPYPPMSRVQLKGYTTGSGKIQETWLDLDAKQTIETDLAELSQQIDHPFIFVSHCPPYDTPLDVIDSGAHVGSLSIRRFIEHWSDQNMLLASLHGHIHESPSRSGSIMTQINTALCINPGQSTTLQYVLLELTPETDPPNIEILYSKF